MKVHLFLPYGSQYFLNISVDVAVEICSEYWATYGDSEVTIINAATSTIVTKFKPASKDQFYTIEQLVELKPYFYEFNIVDAQP